MIDGVFWKIWMNNWLVTDFPKEEIETQQMLAVVMFKEDIEK